MIDDAELTRQAAGPVRAFASPSGFRIGSMLAWIAVIAVCLAAIRADPALGLLGCCSLLPAIGWTSIVSRNRRLIGQPMDFREQAIILIKTSIYAAWVTLINICVFVISWIGTRYWLSSAVAVSISVAITVMVFTVDRKPFDAGDESL